MPQGPYTALETTAYYGPRDGADKLSSDLLCSAGRADELRLAWEPPSSDGDLPLRPLDRTAPSLASSEVYRDV